ncbi:hypothetical protein ABW20_dc0109574 [Dactylellina cionopaga]|nr:hypothetical protein ABW20_dc0109574 [Dactylellina cionopaga]
MKLSTYILFFFTAVISEIYAAPASQFHGNGAAIGAIAARNPNPQFGFGQPAGVEMTYDHWSSLQARKVKIDASIVKSLAERLAKWVAGKLVSGTAEALVNKALTNAATGSGQKPATPQTPTPQTPEIPATPSDGTTIPPVQRLKARQFGDQNSQLSTDPINAGFQQPADLSNTGSQQAADPTNAEPSTNGIQGSQTGAQPTTDPTTGKQATDGGQSVGPEEIKNTVLQEMNTESIPASVISKIQSLPAEQVANIIQLDETQMDQALGNLLA